MSSSSPRSADPTSGAGPGGAGVEGRGPPPPLPECAGDLEVAGVEGGPRTGIAGGVEGLERVGLDQLAVRLLPPVGVVGDGRGRPHPEEFLDAGREGLLLVAPDVAGRGRHDHPVAGREEGVEKELPVLVDRIAVPGPRRRG